jgi:hypothetical protein
MTAYWDDLTREVRDASHLPDDDFVEAVVDIETRVIRAVSLTTGDREFPDDLRESLQSIIMRAAIDYTRFACNRPGEQNERSRSWLLTMRSSCLIGDLHRAFHDVAARRPPNRYDAYFTDDPTNFLRARDAATRAVQG